MYAYSAHHQQQQHSPVTSLNLRRPPSIASSSSQPTINIPATTPSQHKQSSSPAFSSDSTCFSPSLFSLSSTISSTESTLSSYKTSNNKNKKNNNNNTSSSEKKKRNRRAQATILSNIKSFFSSDQQNTRKRTTTSSPPPTLNFLQKNIEILSSSSKLTSLDPIVTHLAESMRTSLLDTNSATMLPSLITALPSGKETGTYLSVDVGGSTLRIALVQLYGRSSGINPCALAAETHPINEAIKSLDGAQFFQWIGCHIKSLLDIHGYSSSTMAMGLSWSFPFAQLESVSRGTILTMGKGYHVADEIAGWDLKDAFEECFQGLGLDITLTAIVNDTVAALLSHAYMNPTTRAAVILGTGVNSSALIGGNKLINTEMSLMGGASSAEQQHHQEEGILPQTAWDKDLDSRVERPGFQPFETMVSGRYLGEVARLIILDLAKSKVITLQGLKGGCGSNNNNTNISSGGGCSNTVGTCRHHRCVCSPLVIPYGFETATMAQIEGLYYPSTPLGPQRQQMKKAKHVFEQYARVQVSDTDFNNIGKVLHAISDRAAAWIAASIVSLVMNLNDDSSTASTTGGTTTIAYSGTVIEKYPGFKQRCQSTLQDLGQRVFGLDTKLRLEPALDGTLFGPAIASAMFAGGARL